MNFPLSSVPVLITKIPVVALTSTVIPSMASNINRYLREKNKTAC